MERNAILFSKVDREDGWVCGGIVFKVVNTKNYQDAYDEVKDKLETPSLVNHIIEKHCLLADLFNYDETFKFVRTYWEFGLNFVFENSDGDETEYRMCADFVCVI